MPREHLHRFEQDGKRFAIDPETCFCFECDAISWDVLEYYPETPETRICHLLGDKHDVKELAEVVSELEWLRATKSILHPPKAEDFPKQFEIERGLKRMTVRLAWGSDASYPSKRGWFGGSDEVASGDSRGIGEDAVALLLGRSEAQQELEVEFVEEEHVHDPVRIAALCARALRAARLADKKVLATVHLTNVALAKAPKALEGHSVSVKLAFQDGAAFEEHLDPLAKVGPTTLSRLAKMVQPAAENVFGRIVVRPNRAEFGDVVAELDAAGFGHIELDLDGAYVANPGLKSHEMVAGLRKTAVYYAEKLSEQHYFRVDPIASLFWRIYNGSPVARSDPAGTNELAVDETGALYPSRLMLGAEKFRVGSLADGVLDEENVKSFDDVGSVTTPVCRRCWVRNLCGGGTAAVHDALTGSFRQPHEPWCEAQRSWMAAAVSAFTALSTKGVNFARVYDQISHKAKPSFLTLVRAAFRMPIAMRPIEESDAEMLVQWENWCEAAYFLCNETGLLMATKYDREMDSLHPLGTHQELIVTRKNGTPIGLLKIRPEPVPGTAQAWVYLRDDRDYASTDVRRGFRTLLQEASKQESIRRLTVPAMEQEKPLQQFLEAVGFEREGILREALYLHGAYHDVGVYGISL